MTPKITTAIRLSKAMLSNTVTLSPPFGGLAVPLLLVPNDSAAKRACQAFPLSQYEVFKVHPRSQARSFLFSAAVTYGAVSRLIAHLPHVAVLRKPIRRPIGAVYASRVAAHAEPLVIPPAPLAAVFRHCYALPHHALVTPPPNADGPLLAPSDTATYARRLTVGEGLTNT